MKKLENSTENSSKFVSFAKHAQAGKKLASSNSTSQNSSTITPKTTT